MDLKSILSAKQGLEKVMGDILRVLAIYRRLWLSEVYSEIVGMNRTLGEEEPSMSDVIEAVKNLEHLGYVELKKSMRASFSSTSSVEDFLVSLQDPYRITPIIMSDEKLRRYNEIRYSVLGTKKNSDIKEA